MLILQRNYMINFTCKNITVLEYCLSFVTNRVLLWKGSPLSGVAIKKLLLFPFYAGVSLAFSTVWTEPLSKMLMMTIKEISRKHAQ